MLCGAGSAISDECLLLAARIISILLSLCLALFISLLIGRSEISNEIIIVKITQFLM